MSKKIKIPLLLLVLVQGAHSIEEYVGRLWEVFEPARLLSGLFSDDLVTGFLIVNIGLFVFGSITWLLFAFRKYAFTRVLIWIMIVIELINGIGHPVWTFTQGSYTPGMITAPILLVLAIYISRKLTLNTPDPTQTNGYSTNTA